MNFRDTPYTRLTEVENEEVGIRDHVMTVTDEMRCDASLAWYFNSS